MEAGSGVLHRSEIQATCRFRPHRMGQERFLDAKFREIPSYLSRGWLVQQNFCLPENDEAKCENKGSTKSIMPLSRVKVAVLPATRLRLHDLGRVCHCSGKKQQAFLLNES